MQISGQPSEFRAQGHTWRNVPVAGCVVFGGFSGAANGPGHWPSASMETVYSSGALSLSSGCSNGFPGLHGDAWL